MSFFKKLLPLWIFIVLFKTSGVLHYALIGVLGLHVLPLWAVGIATGATTFLQLLLDIPAGKCIDRYGARFALRISTFFFLIAVVVLLFGLSPITYGLTLLFSSLGWLFFTPSLSAYLLSETPAPYMGRVTSLRRVMEGIGGTLGTMALASIVTLPVPTLGLILSYPLVGAHIILWFIWKPARSTTHSRHHTRAKVAQSDLATLKKILVRLSPAAPLLAAWTFVSGSISGLLWLVIPLGIAGHLLQIPGYSLSIFDGTTLLTGLFLGNFVDKTKRLSPLLLGALAAYLLTIVLLASAQNILFVFLIFLFSTLNGTITTALWAWLDRLDTDHHQDGMLSGFMTLTDDLGWAFGPMIGGVLFAAIGPSLTIFSATIPALFFLLFMRRMVK